MVDKKTTKQTRERDPDRFLSGVFVLSVSTVIVKILGLLYKIPMIASLGAEGMGYFNSAAEIYAVLCVISTAGLPVALSMLISANAQKGAMGAIRRIDRAATSMFLLLGALGSALMIGFAEPIALSIGNADAERCILAIAPALFFVCCSSAIRGYFQGFQNMVPTAISQLIEAVGKLVFGVCFASVAIRMGYSLPTVAAFAVLGLTLGTFLSSVYLLICKAIAKKRRGTRGASDPTIKERYWLTLLRIALPITVSSSVLSITRLSDMALMMRRLQEIGVSVSQANVLYGSYTTLAVPVFSLIPALITPIALVSVPQLSAAIESREYARQSLISERSIRLTMLFSIPAAMGISVYAEPILSLLFSGEGEAVAIAAPLLAILGLSIPFAGLITTTNALLQSYRQTVKPILSMLTGAAVKIVSAYVLLGIEEIGIYGAPISTFLCNLTVTVMNLLFLSRCVPKGEASEGMASIYGKPLGAATMAMLASLAVYAPILRRSEGGAVAFLVAAAVAVFAYFGMLFLIGGVSEEDLSLLPMGDALRIRLKKRIDKKNKKREIKDGMTK